MSTRTRTGRLREVHVEALDAARLEPMIGPERMARFEQIADASQRAFAGRTVLNINCTATGGTWLNPDLGARMAATPDGPSGALAELSDREIDVLRLIALGHTNNEIADQLYLSVRTVETHRARIQQKLGVSTRAELVRYALDNDLIDR